MCLAVKGQLSLFIYYLRSTEADFIMRHSLPVVLRLSTKYCNSRFKSIIISI